MGRKTQAAQRSSNYRASFSKEKNSQYLEKAKNRMSIKKQNESKEESDNRKQKNAQHHKLKRQQMSEEEKVKTREWHANHKATQRSNETPEEKSERIKKIVNIKKARIESETVEETACRLEKRQKEKEFTWEKFEEERNNTNLEACSICHRLMFEKGRTSLITSKINEQIVEEICSTENGKEAFEKFEDKMVVCHRCYTAFTSKTPHIPSQIYWNYYYPGNIPPELQDLSSVEIRLISRLIPHLRIVKLEGPFGQYGLKGQAVIFASDVTEVQDQVLNVLPRKTDDIGLMVIVESLENVERQREFRINRQKVENALRWLIQNNHCYKDLTIDMENFVPNHSDFVTEVPPVECESVKNNLSWKPVGKKKDNFIHILRGHRNYNSDSFGDNAGKQGLCMALLAIVRHSVKPVEDWIEVDIENVLQLGNRLHKDSLTDVSEATQSDLSEISIDFNNVRRCFKLYETPYELVFTHFVHNVSDFSQKISQFLQDNSYGIMSYDNVYLTIVVFDQSYYFFDYRQRGPSGYACKVHGTAAVMRFKKFENFVARLKSQIKMDNKNQFVLTKVLISSRSESQNFVSTFGDDTPPLFANPLLKSVNIESQEDVCFMEPFPVNNNFTVYASRCQSSNRYGYATQCTAMAAASIIRSCLFEPHESWTTAILNEILDAGNELYHKSLIDKNGAIRPEFLSADEVRKNIRIYGCKVTIHQELIPVQRLISELQFGVEYFFQQSTHGIFTCQNKSFAIMSSDEAYWIFDSHDNGSGKARLERFSSLDDLIELLGNQINEVSETEKDVNMTCFSITTTYAVINDDLDLSDDELENPYVEGSPIKSQNSKHKLPSLRRKPDVSKKLRLNSVSDDDDEDIEMVDLVSIDSYSNSIDSIDEIPMEVFDSDEELENEYMNLQISPLKEENNEEQCEAQRTRISFLNRSETHSTIESQAHIQSENIDSNKNNDITVIRSLHLSKNEGQCLCISVSAVFYDYGIPFSNWKVCDLKKIQQNGDDIYEKSDANDLLGESMYIDDVLNEKFKIKFSNKEILFLENYLSEFFSSYARGIILVDIVYCLAIFKRNNLYGLYDSHTCSETGKPTKYGSPCVIITQNFAKFVKIIKGRVSPDSKFTLLNLKVDNKFVKETSIRDENKSRPKRSIPVDPTLFDKPIPIPVSIMRPIDFAVPRPREIFDMNTDENTEDMDSDNIPLVQIKRKTAAPVNDFHEKRFEELCFPTLFPYGIHGVNDNEKRNPVPSRLDYAQLRIMGKDPRFKKNKFLVHCLCQVEKHRVSSSISMCGNLRQGDQQIQNLTSNLHLVMRTVRGSSAYWNNSYLDLLSMVKNLGPGHLFLTLSCNDLNWPHMLKACLTAEGRGHVDPSTLDDSERRRLIENNPVIVSRIFNKEIQNILRLLKNGKALGYKAKDIWFRIEFQQRGSPHFHALIWLENFPMLDSPAGIKAMDTIARCDIPHDHCSLKQLVQRYQIHHHTQTCYKNRQDGERICRFGFPRPPCQKTRVLDIDTPEFLRNGHRIVEMKRPQDSRYVNNYNANILKYWQGNMDIQFITSPAIVGYIAKYSCKAEPEWMSSIISEAIKEARQSSDEMGKKLFKIGMKILNQREVSCCEAAYRLCHLPLRGSTRSTVFINAAKAGSRYRMLDIKHGTDNTYYSDIVDRYIRRPDVMEEISLAEFGCLYQPYYYKKNASVVVDEEDGDAEESANLQGNQVVNEENEKKILKIYKLKKLSNLDKQMFVQERTKPAICRSRYFSPTGSRVEYFYSLLILHLPFRNENELLQKLQQNNGNANVIARYEDDDTETAFMDKRHLLRPLRQEVSFEEYKNAADEINLAILQVRALMDDNGDLREDDEPQRERDGFLATPDDYGDDGLEAQHVPVARAERYKHCDPSRLNEGQKRPYQYVQRVIKADLQGKNPKPMKLFITGSAGVGKSVLIDNIVKLISDSYAPIYKDRPVVKIGAPTGVAALLVNGETLHKILSLGVEHGKVAPYKKLTGKYLEDQRQVWRNIKFLIIDEISMVSYQQFRNISKRLQELFENDLPFGGIHMLVFGDLMQLRPVVGHPVFEQPEIYKAEPHLWSNFDFCELTQNMRQKDDLEFSEILNALRVGELGDCHLEMIFDRVESEVNKREGIFADENATLITPVSRVVDEHNEKVLKKLTTKSPENPNPPKLYTITAIDRLVENPNNLQNIDKAVPKDVKKCCGIPKTIELAVGARVMLRRNVSVGKGLVNGSMGKVVGFTWRNFRKDQIEDGEQPQSVLIDFGTYGIHQIEPMTCTFNANGGYGKVERLQVPVIVAYAVTAHKLQGVTVETAVLDLSKNIFQAGQAYVMLSRVRNLSKVLILENFADYKLLRNCADHGALQELRRLRRLERVDWEILIFQKEQHHPGKRL